MFIPRQYEKYKLQKSRMAGDHHNSTKLISGDGHLKLK